MRKARRPKTTIEFIYAELRLVRNELKKANFTLDSLLRIEMQKFDPRDYESSDDDQP